MTLENLQITMTSSSITLTVTNFASTNSKQCVQTRNILVDVVKAVNTKRKKTKGN